MSHLDDLDEYEAELELALKKEYQAVFALFRYCVLTQDATYLCNKLDVQQAAPTTAGGLPFFQLDLEDVWVWDKNRPTRIIPRTKVFTSGDVTVEELRGEGDEPTLTAEALAERIGEPFRARRRVTSSPRCCSRSTSATRRPSSGSTTATELGERWRIATEAQRTGDELGVAARATSSTLARLDGICLSSTVPRLIPEYEHVAERWAKVELLVHRAGRPTGDPDPVRRPARGRPGPDHERGRGASELLRRAGDRRRLRHVDELRRRLGRRASTSAACSRRGSRSRWTRCSRGRRGS